jgi:hypothetical protein
LKRCWLLRKRHKKHDEFHEINQTNHIQENTFLFSRLTGLYELDEESIIYTFDYRCEYQSINPFYENVGLQFYSFNMLE